jgi:hypothetical protein
LALSFAKKKSAANSSAADDDTPKKVQTKATAFGFLKKGDAAKKAIAADEAKAELAKSEAGKLWRFWMPPEEDRKITFLDGDLDEDGMLDINMYHEHSIKLNGNWQNFVCTEESEGYCPLCEKGESKASLVGVMTIIDHTPHKIKQGPNAGKVIENTRKLFVAKKQTLKLLNKIAVKRGGLAGCTFDVSRADEKTASVGSQFDFVEKNSLADIAEGLEMSLEDISPANYAEEIVYRTSEELIELGVGKAASGPGYEKGVGSKKNLQNEL